MLEPTIGFASANLQFFERLRPYAFLNVETNAARNMPENFKANGTITIL